VDLRGLAIDDNLSGLEPSVARPFRAVQPAQKSRPTEASLDVSGGHDPASLVDLARQHRDAGNFAAAERCLAQVQAAWGSDLALLAEREELRLRHSEQRLAVARRRAAHDPHPKAQALVARMEDEHRRLEIELLNMQVERLPQSVELRLELARRLKRMANYSGAVQRLDEALRLAPNSAAVHIELGECWQHLRHFAKALDDYERAVAAADHPDDAKLAAYRSGVLAAALGNAALARERLLSVVQADPAYKDARERLDNLPQS
jgi:tetratricopeptide (TPR) repeat protein